MSEGEESVTVKRMVSIGVLLLLAVIILTACGQEVKPTMTIYIDGTRGCKEQPKPVILWNRAGGGAAHGKGIAEIPHGIRLDVAQTEEYFGITYYQVVYEGQWGWVPENYVSETEPSCR